MFSYKSLIASNQHIKFYCTSKCKDVIPEPYPAKKYIPDWYKRLEMNISKKMDANLLHHINATDIKYETPTIKRCPPFLDAMSAGWIIPLAADIRFNIQDGGAGISWEHDFFDPMIETHSLGQIYTHPSFPLVPVKLINHWIVETSPGWSCLFTPPLNRSDDFLDLLSGIVETDKYFEFINFPGFLKPLADNMTLYAGHPLMQVIPFHREYLNETIVKTLGKKELEKLEKTRNKRSSHRSLYRDTMWQKK